VSAGTVEGKLFGFGAIAGVGSILPSGATETGFVAADTDEGIIFAFGGGAGVGSRSARGVAEGGFVAPDPSDGTRFDSLGEAGIGSMLASDCNVGGGDWLADAVGANVSATRVPCRPGVTDGARIFLGVIPASLAN
jgi:hypothetical protein